MATREEIYTAIRNADKAGDSAGVRKLGEFLQTLPPDTAAASVAPAAAPLSLGQKVAGAAETAYQGTTGLLAAIPAAGAYAAGAVASAAGADVNPADWSKRTQEYFTHQPVTEGAKRFGAAGDAALSSAIRPVAEPVARKFNQVATAADSVSPALGSAVRAAPGAFGAVSTLIPGATGARTAMQAAARTPLSEAPTVLQAARNIVQQPATAESVAAAAAKAPPTAESVLAKQFGAAKQSMGAASAAPGLQNVTPGLKQAIVGAAKKTGGAVEPTALARHTDADEVFGAYVDPKTGKRAHLTEGQATGDVNLISHEQNMRGAAPEFANNFDLQNKALAARAQAIRDEVGPDVFSANHVEHGDTLIKAYLDKAEAADAVTGTAYKALTDANGGHFPVDAQALLQNASQALHKKLLFNHAPSGEMNELKSLAASGKMTFEDFESLRTNLARTIRTSTDGNTVAAAKAMRQAMEDLPLAPEAAHLKPLADKARALAKAQFDVVEADPAYSAAVSGKVSPDDFVRRFVIGGKRDNLALMRQTIGDDPAAAQTMGVAALDHLRDQARLNPHYEGNFAAKSFEKALTAMSPKLQALLPPAAIEKLEQLGRVAKMTTEQPRGSYVSTANSFTAAVAKKAAAAGEVAGNLVVPGLGGGTFLRGKAEGALINRQAARAMAPGAGLTRLRDIGKQP